MYFFGVFYFYARLFMFVNIEKKRENNETQQTQHKIKIN